MQERYRGDYASYESRRRRLANEINALQAMVNAKIASKEMLENIIVSTELAIVWLRKIYFVSREISSHRLSDMRTGENINGQERTRYAANVNCAVSYPYVYPVDLTTVSVDGGTCIVRAVHNANSKITTLSFSPPAYPSLFNFLFFDGARQFDDIVAMPTLQECEDYEKTG